MKVTILGSTGFVGKVLIHKAVERDYQKRTLASLQADVYDLTDLMLEQINSEQWIRKAPLVATIKSST